MNITPATVAAITGAGIVVYILLKQEAKAAAASVGEAINPVNHENIFYEGTNAIGASITGDKSFNLGSYLYDLMHGGNSDQ